MILESIQFSNIYKIADLQAKLDSGYFDDFLVEFSIYLMTEKGLVKINQDKTIEYNVSVDLSNYIKNTDVATRDKLGIVKVGSGLDISNSSLYTVLASNANIDAKSNKFLVITPSNLNYAVKSALSGKINIDDMTKEEQLKARNVIGAISESALNDYIHNGVEIQTSSDLNTYQNEGLYYGLADSTITNKPEDLDSAFGLQVIHVASTMKYQLYYVGGSTKIYIRIFNGTDWSNWETLMFNSNLTNYVKNTDYATKTKGGVVRIGDSSAVGLAINSTGAIYIVNANSNQIDSRNNTYNPITPSNLDYAVRSVYPETKTTIDTIDVNTIYDLGEQTNLSITLPTTGKLGDWLQFDFLSGLTKTTLEINAESGILGFDLIPESNYIYTMYLDWGMIGKNTDDSINYGWRFNYSEYPLNS
mgnify:CR=1 FL=1